MFGDDTVNTSTGVFTTLLFCPGEVRFPSRAGLRSGDEMGETSVELV